MMSSTPSSCSLSFSFCVNGHNYVKLINLVTLPEIESIFLTVSYKCSELTRIHMIVKCDQKPETQSYFFKN